MSQRVLTFTFNKKKYVSKPYNFRTACMIQEKTLKQAQGENLGIFSVCGDAVDYLFEGTEATQDILEQAISAKMRMCKDLWEMYLEDFTGKNDESLTKEQAKDKPKEKAEN